MAEELVVVVVVAMTRLSPNGLVDSDGLRTAVGST